MTDKQTTAPNPEVDRLAAELRAVAFPNSTVWGMAAEQTREPWRRVAQVVMRKMRTSEALGTLGALDGQLI